MEPRIQYAQTKDGVSIAFWTLGEGTPFVQMPVLPVSHCQREWQLPELRTWYERLAEKSMVVRYDCRGFGSSQRDVSDFSLDAQVLDLEAVVDRLGLGKFALLGGFLQGPVAITYAARHPEMLSHLLLWCTWAGASDFTRSPRARALRATRDTDWELYTETVAHAARGWSEVRESESFAAMIREGATEEAMRAAMDVAYEFDAAALPAKVKTPTLVLHRRQAPYPEVDVARGLASQIPGARLAVLEGSALAMWGGDSEAVVAAIEEFLGQGDEIKEAAQAVPSGLVTILFTDMESSTALTRRLGDARAQEVRRTHNTIVRGALKAGGGTEIKHTGDGIMASFTSATRALECAVAIQRGVASHGEEHPESPLAVYIGLNAGEPIAEEEDLFGTSVDLARRICDYAQPGQILASNVVRELSEGKGFLFGDIGDVVPKGFEQPVRLYEVRWEAVQQSDPQTQR